MPASPTENVGGCFCEVDSAVHGDGAPQLAKEEGWLGGECFPAAMRPAPEMVSPRHEFAQTLPVKAHLTKIKGR